MLQSILNAGIIKQTDWSRVRTSLDVAWKEIELGNWDRRKICHSGWNCDLFSLEKNGVIIGDVLEDGTWWKFWSGKWLESLLPWAKSFRQYMSDQGLPISTITYHSHTNTIYEHRDFAYQDQVPDLPHTNINFLISTSSTEQNYTWCKDDHGNEYRYYGRPNSAYFFNADNLHGVMCNGFRDGLIIKLRQPFDKVKTFIDQHPNFLDENQNYFKS